VLRPKAGAPQHSCDLGGIVLVIVANREHPDLYRRQPHREGAGVMLVRARQRSAPPTRQRPVDHGRPMALVVGADVLEAEALRQLQVHLGTSTSASYGDGVRDLH